MCHACTPLIPHTAGVRVDRAAPCRGRRHRRGRTGLCTRAPHVRCCRHGASPRAEHDGGLGCALCAMSGVCLHGVVVHTAIYLHESTHPSPSGHPLLSGPPTLTDIHQIFTPHPRTFGVVMLILATQINITNSNPNTFYPGGVRIEFLSGTSFLAVFGAHMVNESVPLVWTNYGRAMSQPERVLLAWTP
eukprot:scaffold4195_cov63-Phaeocystis_antarctica.AAC.2